jgi:acyl-CoA dehydrogenase
MSADLTMAFELPPEAHEMRAVVRRFVNEHLLPLERHVAREWEWELPEDVQRRLEEAARAIGLCSLTVPTEYGGMGLGFLALMVVKEELGRTIVPFLVPGEPSVILYESNEDQRERFLLPVIRGEKFGAFAQTEPEAGSDPAMMKTRAVADGDSWVVNGHKRFITAAHRADFLQLLAITDPDRRQHGGITCFLVEKGTPGMEIVRRERIMGREAPCEIVFDDCRVPAENVLGAVGQGFALGQRWISAHDRLDQGGYAVGRAERALELATRYAKERVTFGQPLAERQAIQNMLADSFLEIHQCRLMTYHAAAKADQGHDIRVEASMIRLFATEMQTRVIDRAIQIHGGVGLSEDLPLADMYQHVRSFRIAGGASEIQRFIIARHVIRTDGQALY